MPQIISEKYVLPIYWAGYLVNSDATGLKQAEINTIDKWVLETKDNRPCFICTDADNDPHFCYTNDATNIGGDCVTYNFHIS